MLSPPPKKKLGGQKEGLTSADLSQTPGWWRWVTFYIFKLTLWRRAHSHPHLIGERTEVRKLAQRFSASECKSQKMMLVSWVMGTAEASQGQVQGQHLEVGWGGDCLFCGRQILDLSLLSSPFTCQAQLGTAWTMTARAESYVDCSSVWQELPKNQGEGTLSRQKCSNIPPEK